MSLTDKTVGGFIWAFAEKFGVQAMQMVIFIVLAHVISVEAFGLMGMLAVFIAISRSITDSGFGQALIQKKETDEVDYSSVFYMNLAVSTLMYGTLFFSAPYIASFYGQSILVNLVRVLGLKFIIEAFSMVQIARLMKEVKFKKLMLAKLPSTLLGGITGIGAAYLGFGVWSLIIQQLTDITAYSVQVWIQSRWRPTLVFNWQRVKELFDFGGKLMAAGLIDTIYKNIYEIVIGRFFSTAQVGFYTQANKIRQLPVQSISSTLGRVTFPILSEIQNDNQRLKRGYKKIIRQIFLIISPVMFGAIVLAEPLFGFVLTDKWLPAVPYFQWLCVAGLFYPANSYNLNILKVKGRSDLVLNLGIIKKIIITAGVLVLLNYSVLALVIFRACFSILAFFINSYFSGSFIGYNVFEQLKDIWIFFLFSAIMSFIIWFFATSLLDFSNSILLIYGILLGVISYGFLIYYFEQKILFDTVNLIRMRLKG